MQFNAVPFCLVFSAVLIRRDEIFLLSEKYYEFLPDLIRPSIVTSVLGPVSGKTDKFVFRLLGLALTSCSWLQI